MSKLKNYSTTVSASRSIAEIHEALVAIGAHGVATTYERPPEIVSAVASGLRFELDVKGRPVVFDLPADWRGFKRALVERHRVTKARGSSERAILYANRVAWRNIRDWVLAQSAMVEAGMADAEVVFLPYAVTGRGRTVAECLLEGPDAPFLLGGGTKR